ncbi:uncharacterized protein LOC117213849 [Bombus bifarius]|uniref:Uncharacterized protein LOC117213849 n=1 Tax=Bombus bifarius TaxID=103933 RepID=A0A6P8N3W2_9HYME|nr:uncharacterized protein LOC117213849 [Bombus bifarius]
MAESNPKEFSPWLSEKTNAVKALAREQCEATVQLQRQQQLQQHQNQPQLQAPEPAPATTATTTTWPVNHPPCWLLNESRARDEPTKYQPRNARPSCTVPTLSSASSSSTRVNVPTALVALIASSDRGDAQSSERERTQKRGYATGYISR